MEQPLDPTQQLKLLLQNRTTAYLPHPSRDHRSLQRRLPPQSVPFTVTFELEPPTQQVLDNPKLWDKIPTLEPTSYHRDTYRTLMTWRIPEGVEQAIKAHMDTATPGVRERHAQHIGSYHKTLDTVVECLTEPTKCNIFRGHLISDAVDFCIENKIAHPNEPQIPITEDNVADLTDDQILDAIGRDTLEDLTHNLSMPELTYRYEARWDNIFGILPELVILHPSTNCHYTIFAAATPTQIFITRGDAYGSGTREVLGYYGYGYEILTPTPRHFVVTLKADSTVLIRSPHKAPYYPSHGCNYKNPHSPSRR
jgi:hypothetical protein